MSFSIAFGSTRSSTNCRTVACTSRCSGVSSKSTTISLSRVGLGALFQVALALVSGGNQQPTGLPSLTLRQKAALVVVSGLPAPTGVAGVIVQGWSRSEPRPRRTLAFVDQEGGSASTFNDLPPWAPASSFQGP